MEKEIFEKIKELRELQNLKQTKFTGAMTSEVIREYLKKEGFNISERDVFIKGLPNEIDLLILKEDARPIFNSYYDPLDVVAVFELKYSGIYSEEEPLKIQKVFENVRSLNSSILCVYLTVFEREKYRYKATKENLNAEVFELFRLQSDINSVIKKGLLEDSIKGDWKRLIGYLKKLK